MSSSSLGAMGSLLGKLCSLLVSPEDQLPEPLQLQKDKLELLKLDLEEINKFLVNLSWMEAPNMMVKHWMNEVRDLSYDIEDYIDKTMHSDPNTDEVSSSAVDELSSLVKKAKDAHERHNSMILGVGQRILDLWSMGKAAFQGSTGRPLNLLVLVIPRPNLSSSLASMSSGG